ncbi:MAG TPA: DNA repair protein RecO [Polyangiaceae bacterium]|nr:DNA repair protein RecO [Polyangiaceae bacterium]
MRGARAARPHTSTRALLLRRVEHGESDLVLALFTEKAGRVSALARAARKSRKRFGGSLEAFHTLAVELDEPTSGELHQLREATLAVVRHRLTADLARMDAAGRALAWLRSAAPPRHPEPELWNVVTRLLDRLDSESAPPPKLVLAEEGLRFLAALGWGLTLGSCVRCGKPCEPGKAAMIDPVRGGLVCRACGGARFRVSGAARARLAKAELAPPDVDLALDLVERALAAHAGVEPPG